jgi:lipopolysaccharide transport system permease protein
MTGQPAMIEREIAANRGLLLSFVVRELRARYAGSAMGVFWAVVHPLILLLLYIAVFSTLTRGATVSVRGHAANYAIFLCPALLAWNWMNESLLGACQSVTGNAALIRRVAFPVGILPAASLVAGLVPFATAMLLFLVFAATVGAFHPVSLLLLPPLALLQIALMMGPAYLLASLNVAVRDTAQILMAGLQVLFWSSPIVYEQQTLESSLPWTRWWFNVNPVAHLMAAYRDVIVAHRIPAAGRLLYLLVLAVILHDAGRRVFQHARRRFADDV